MKRTRRYMALLALLLMHPLAMADSITLRPTARATVDGAIVLSDIAVLEGDEAQALAGLVLVEDIARAARARPWVVISVSDVRDTLEAAEAPLSRLSISGGDCTIRLSAPPRDAGITETKKTKQDPSSEVVEDASGATIRSQVASAIARLLGAEQGSVRLLFDRSDESFLSQTTWGRRVAVQPTTSGSASMVLVEVRVFSGTDAQLLERRRLRVEAEVRRRVLVMTGSLRRGRPIQASDVEPRELWMEVGGSAPIHEVGDAIGSITRRRLDAGEILRASDLEPPILIERGQMVTVHCLRSGFEVRSRARAQSDGRLGEMIELSLDGSRRAFTARVNGRGEAVMDLDHMHDPREKVSER